MRKILTSLLTATLVNTCCSPLWAQGPITEVLDLPCVVTKSCPGGWLMIATGARRPDFSPAGGPIAKAVGLPLAFFSAAPHDAPPISPAADCQEEPTSHIGDCFSVFFEHTQHADMTWAQGPISNTLGLQLILPESATNAKTEAPLLALSSNGDDKPGGWVSVGVGMYFLTPVGGGNSAGHQVITGSSVGVGYGIANTGVELRANLFNFTGSQQVDLSGDGGWYHSLKSR